MRILVGLLAVACCLLPATGAAKDRPRYNIWAKEKIRYHYDRVQRDPYNVQRRVLLAIAYYSDDNYYEAARHLERAIELEPDYAEAHCNLGIVRHTQSRVIDAEKHYRLALDNDSTMVEAMAGLGTLLCANGRRGEGIEFLERTLARDARRDDARYNLGVAYFKVQDYRRSIVHLETLMARRVDYPGVRLGLSQSYFARGLTLLQAKQPEAALPFFGQSLALRGAADVFYAQGIAHLQLEDLAAAEVAFAAAVQLEEDHVPALHNLAHVLERTDRPTEAEVYYRRVAILTPHLDTIGAARDATYDETYLLE